MPTNPRLKAPFYFEADYHIVFKCIDGLKLFLNESDYIIFKKRFCQFLFPYFEQYAFCLLENHTHHVLKVASCSVIEKHIHSLIPEERGVLITKYLDDKTEENLDLMLEKQIAKFMVSYANYIGNKYNRRGGLFQKPFKRIRIESESHLQNAIIYVNANAEHHKLTTDFKKHTRNGFYEFVNNQFNFITKESVVSVFATMELFIKLHQDQVNYYKNHWTASKLE